MVNILIPSGGKSEFFADSYYPKTIYEVNGMPMIQQVINNYNSIKEKKFIFGLLHSECDKYHVDRIVSMLTDGKSDVFRLKNVTGGALCTCLMALECIDADEPLIIANNDQIIDADFNQVLNEFTNAGAEVGVICFKSVHPRWSYVRTEGEIITEAVEKQPVSQKAIAGFYFFKKGKDFINAAQKAILKGYTYNNLYYITAAVNEMILENKKVCYFELNDGQYHSFYSPEKVHTYEELCKQVVKRK